MALMDSDERQQLFDVLVDFYKDTFRSMSDEQRGAWFSSMDEVVIRSFWVGDDQAVAEAEQKHAVKLLAIAHALMAHPCCTGEMSAIEALVRLGFATQECAERGGDGCSRSVRRIESV